MGQRVTDLPVESLVSADAPEAHVTALPVEVLTSRGSYVLWIEAPGAADGLTETFELVLDEFSEVLRVTLDTAYRLTTATLLLGSENAGSKTYTIEGANDPEYGDAVELASRTFTATGSFTTDTVTFSWSSPTAYRYYRLIGPGGEEIRIVEFQMFDFGPGLPAHDHPDGHDEDHAARHHTDGDDPLAPEDIGAAAEDHEHEGGSAEDAATTREVQSPQVRRFLGRDGMWRDPFVTGLGTVDSVGTPATVTDDTKYNAWPVVCRMRDGRLLLVYVKGDTHHSDTTGNVVGKISNNNGASWGSEFTIYDHASLWASVASVSAISTGRVFVTVWRDNPASAGSLVGGYVYSDDNGATWSAWIDFTTTYTTEEFPVSAITELPNGDLLVLLNGRTGGSALQWDCVSLRSTDGGATFGSQATLVAYATYSRFHTESQIVLLDNDEILVLHRTSNLSGTTYSQRSTDNGATWSAPAVAFDGYGQPNCIQLSTGTLVAITRRNSDAAVIAYLSTDRGATWGSAVLIDDSMNEMEYGCPVELPGVMGRFLVVYGSQPTSSTSNSDIDQAILVEDVASIDDHSGLATDAELAAHAADPNAHHDADSGGGGAGQILISDDPSTPLVFADLIQNEAQDDLVYADT